jgi:hypothetical protein
MGNINLLKLNDFVKWNIYIIKLPSNQQDIYFTPEYYRLYEELGDGKAQLFIFEKNGEFAMYPFLINSVNDLGYIMDKEYFDIQGAYGYNGLCCSCNDPQFIMSFYKSLNHYCIKNNIIAEFTRFHPLLQNHNISSDYMTVIQDRETVMIDLQKPYSEIWANDYSSKNRNMIRKARAMGYKLQGVKYPDIQDIDSFIRIYNYTMDDVKSEKYFYFNREFFFNTFGYLKEHALLFKVLDYKDEVICSSIFFHFGNYFHYHLSGRSVKADNSVNNFLIDGAIVHAKEKGAKYFHLGGGRGRSPDDSLMKFKKSFSKQILPFYIGWKIHNKKKYDEVVKQWSKKFPEKVEKYKNFVLKYRN